MGSMVLSGILSRKRALIAGVATTAVKDGDEYIVNGSKIWTSGAEDADWIFCLVRTNGQVQKQKGIGFLLIDLRFQGSR